VSFVKERYSKASAKVKFPIEPESFFVEDVAAQKGIVGQQLLARVAA
jgi:hypothetical protein